MGKDRISGFLIHICSKNPKVDKSAPVIKGIVSDTGLPTLLSFSICESHISNQQHMFILYFLLEILINYPP